MKGSRRAGDEELAGRQACPGTRGPSALDRVTALKKKTTHTAEHHHLNLAQTGRALLLVAPWEEGLWCG